jgi:hydroxymethylpyrimidine kinase/phosphomethylpyrimidine kinase/thiamine-phosphate diphosphorylase
MNQTSINQFPRCGDTPLGLYPIVDSIAWLHLLLPTGVTTFQLRLKNKKDLDIETEIKLGIALAKKFQARLFINDYWQLAIKYKAYGVHLGQENLLQADISAIYQAGLRLGISTHNDDEIKKALLIKPSYIACGPVFPTTSKKMLFGPLGVPQLQHWQQTLHYPLVAIGGINLENLSQVLATGVNGIAMISAITQADDPVGAAQEFLKRIEK